MKHGNGNGNTARKAAPAATAPANVETAAANVAKITEGPLAAIVAALLALLAAWRTWRTAKADAAAAHAKADAAHAKADAAAVAKADAGQQAEHAARVAVWKEAKAAADAADAATLAAVKVWADLWAAYTLAVNPPADVATVQTFLADEAAGWIPATALAVADAAEYAMPAAMAAKADGAYKAVAAALNMPAAPETADGLTAEWAEANAETFLAAATGAGAVAAGARTVGTLAQCVRMAAVMADAGIPDNVKPGRLDMLAAWLEPNVAAMLKKSITAATAAKAAALARSAYAAMMPVAELRATWPAMLESGQLYPEHAREAMRNLRENTGTNPATSGAFLAAFKAGGWENADFHAKAKATGAKAKAKATGAKKHADAVADAVAALCKRCKVELPAKAETALRRVMTLAADAVADGGADVQARLRATLAILETAGQCAIGADVATAKVDAAKVRRTGRADGRAATLADADAAAARAK